METESSGGWARRSAESAWGLCGRMMSLPSSLIGRASCREIGGIFGREGEVSEGSVCGETAAESPAIKNNKVRGSSYRCIRSTEI